jgi:Ca2+-binding EF-hand superfamily protein
VTCDCEYIGCHPELTGGSTYSIIRDLFLYWDADRSGDISAKELSRCMKSLGIIMTQPDLEAVVAFYDNGRGEHEMSYLRLLQDIRKGEPTLVEFVETKAGVDDNEPRFDEVADEFVAMPQIVVKFLEATHNWILFKMRHEGGTPFFHIHRLFEHYDHDYSNGLNVHELQLAAMRGMDLVMTKENAQAIIKYYDRKRTGDLKFDQFLPDVDQHIKPVFHFHEQTSQQIADKKASLAKNPFLPKPFKAAPNKILEKFKKDVKASLMRKVNAYGVPTELGQGSVLGLGHRVQQTAHRTGTHQGCRQAAGSYAYARRSYQRLQVLRSVRQWGNALHATDR